MGLLLAVDLGIRTGMALYGADGRLIWFRSHNYGNVERLRRGAHRLLAGIGDLDAIVVEGGGSLAAVWEREAERRGIPLHHVSAEAWREIFLLPRERRSGLEAKRFAGDRARMVIAWSGLSPPKSLRHDAAEAILVGLWGALRLRLLSRLPAQLGGPGK